MSGKRRRVVRRVLWVLGVGAAALPLLAFFAFEAFVFVARWEGEAPLPAQFGNFPRNRAVLEKQPRKAEFAFAVVGDTRSVGTFERICAELRGLPLDFAVLLGDCAYGGTEEHHRYFRAECAHECALPFPVFYVVGNHDVSPDRFPVSRFEEVYGPSIFKFEYQECLFVVLRVLDAPFSNEASVAFLERLGREDLGRYRYRFAFMHIPPPISPDVKARTYKEAGRLVALFERLGIDYVFAGDFHGYARVTRRGTRYIITGGGGAHLHHTPNRQFHHAMVIRVGPDSVAERLVPVAECVDFEDQLEKAAVVRADPWMRRHPVLSVLINLAVLAALLALGVAAARGARRRAPAARESGGGPPDKRGRPPT